MMNKSFELVLLVILTAGLGATQETPSESQETPEPSASEATAPVPYGSGEEAQPGYVGQITPENLFVFSLDADTAYDTDALNTSGGPRGDTTASVGPRFSLLEGRKHVNLAIDYLPYFVLYNRFSQFDQLNHVLDFDATAQVSQRFALRLRNSASYINTTTGIFTPRSSQFVPGLGSPTTQEATVLIPQAHFLEENARLDALYKFTSRNTLDLFGNFVDYKYTHLSNPSQRLLNAEGGGGGAEFSRRVTATTTLALLYMFQNVSVGTNSRMVTHGVLFSYAQQLSPTVALSLFAGPQFTRDHNTFAFELSFLGLPLTFVSHAVHSQWQPAYGGSLIKRTKNTYFEISGQRMVNGGGGFLGVSTNTSGDLTVRRRLSARWQGFTDVSYFQSDALSFNLFKSRIRYGGAGAGLERSLTEKLTGRLQYNFLRQRETGQIPLLADIDRHRVSLGLFYQVGSIPLGQ